MDSGVSHTRPSSSSSANNNGGNSCVSRPNDFESQHSCPASRPTQLCQLYTASAIPVTQLRPEGAYRICFTWGPNPGPRSFISDYLANVRYGHYQASSIRPEHRTPQPRQNNLRDTQVVEPCGPSSPRPLPQRKPETQLEEPELLYPPGTSYHF
ncbi:hypothetical protein SUNI508_10781 [Seiridium unicorne]|uniref:Uncharacterized protein n=1 Tax=Seiridium unicorne TaxID=138068 RepID=A0ABR2UK28_9PEZI